MRSSRRSTGGCRSSQFVLGEKRSSSSSRSSQQYCGVSHCVATNSRWSAPPPALAIAARVEPGGRGGHVDRTRSSRPPKRSRTPGAAPAVRRTCYPATDEHRLRGGRARDHGTDEGDRPSAPLRPSSRPRANPRAGRAGTAWRLSRMRARRTVPPTAAAASARSGSPQHLKLLSREEPRGVRRGRRPHDGRP